VDPPVLEITEDCITDRTRARLQQGVGDCLSGEEKVTIERVDPAKMMCDAEMPQPDRIVDFHTVMTTAFTVCIVMLTYKGT